MQKATIYCNDNNIQNPENIHAGSKNYISVEWHRLSHTDTHIEYERLLSSVTFLLIFKKKKKKALIKLLIIWIISFIHYESCDFQSS